MTDFLQFGILGLAVGSLYGLSAQGLVVVYRGSGVLNFASGAIGVAGAYLFWELHANAGLSYAPAFALAVLAAACFGVLVHVGVMRRLQRSTPLVRVVATL